MKLKTLIIDDEPDALDKLARYVKEIPFLDLVAQCHGTSQAMQYLAEGEIDVLFTDIEMPDVNGVEFVETLVPKPLIVFTTAYREYALDGFRLSAVDYLLKPYGMAEFQHSANKVLSAWQGRQKIMQRATQTPQRDSIFVKVNTRFERINLPDIRFIKGFGEYLQIYLASQPRPLLTISSFQAMMEKLNHNFVQVHRSYIVNMNHVCRIEKMRVMMEDDTIIPISASQKDSLIEYLEHCTVGKLPK